MVIMCVDIWLIQNTSHLKDKRNGQWLVFVVFAITYNICCASCERTLIFMPVRHGHS